MPTEAHKTKGRAAKGRGVKRRARGRSLGIDADGPAELVRQVRTGFKSSSLKQLQEATGLSMQDIARFAGISQRTLNRRQAERRLKADESDRLLRVATLVDMVVDLFEGDTNEARRWLDTPQPGLGGEVPMDFASTEVGAREVEYLITRLEHGIFA